MLRLFAPTPRMAIWEEKSLDWLTCRLGASSPISLSWRIPLCSSASALSVAIEIGTSMARSARFWAVTTTSSRVLVCAIVALASEPIARAKRLRWNGLAKSLLWGTVSLLHYSIYSLIAHDEQPQTRSMLIRF